MACLLFVSAQAQPAGEMSSEKIRMLVGELKSDPRGPFQGIRWFCPDGSVLPATSRCPTPGGIQHGLSKTEIDRLARTNHLFLGQILAGAEYADFLDEAHGFARLKQYQIERYLVRSDDGWIFRRARFYRGAFQAEDEEAWGRGFLEWMLKRTDLIHRHFFLMRESVRDVPHGESKNLAQRIRAVSKEVSDAYPAFLDVRVKIHGQPEASDTLRVAGFRRDNAGRMPPALLDKLDNLRRDMRAYYSTNGLKRIRDLLLNIRGDTETKRRIASIESSMPAGDLLPALADAATAARRDIEAVESGRDRLRLMDVSLEIEALAFRSAGSWQPATIGQALSKFRALTNLALGAGLIEWWEAGEINFTPTTDSLSFDAFRTVSETAQRVVGWGIGMVSATFEQEVARYQPFEPLANGFLDDRMRSTVLLTMGEAAGQLAGEQSRRSGRVNHLMGLSRQGGIRGLNPGLAVGELVVQSGSSQEMDFRPDAIYMLDRAPADLKPVAGIGTVSEGNLVSHVQLLARNLGIPNAVVSPETLQDMRRYSGQKVFYAVSPGGVVLMKPAADMDRDERRLIEQRKRSEERIRVPTARVDLTATNLEGLRDLRAGDSGRVCGPKAANLGQLTTIFPENVAPGFIIPFGVFKQHMDQKVPGQAQTYWTWLASIFSDAEKARGAGQQESDVEQKVLAQLAELRTEIERMPLIPTFVVSLKQRFLEVLGEPLGRAPVFVRSDTNMEDLKDFTGAGLNLTIPNVVSEADVLQAIRRVWASPYRERGYRWRQKYLLNPEDVYPSLLILRSINADKSGVMITSGVASGVSNHFTVAFNRGVSGAVDGQAAEMYDLAPAGNQELLAPAREPEALTLPASGGTQRVQVAFNERVLSSEDLHALVTIGTRIRQSLPGTPGIETNGPFDIELGFLGSHLWLFQTRPFVENRSAAQSTYLSRMDIRDARVKRVHLSDKLHITR